MATLTGYLIGQVIFAFVIALALAGVARLSRRQYEGSRFPTAARMFSIWWAGLGAAWVTWAIDTLVVHTANSPRGLSAGLDYVLVAIYFTLIIVSFGSLFYYLLFVYVGSARLSWTVWVIYGGLAIALALLLLTANPPGDYQVTGLYGSLYGDYQQVAGILQAILLLPVIGAAVGLFFVARRASDPGQRYRVLLISSALTFYLILPLVFGSNPGVEPSDARGWIRELVNKIALLTAVAAMWLAYHPPAWVVRRFRLEGSD